MPTKSVRVSPRELSGFTVSRKETHVMVHNPFKRESKHQLAHPSSGWESPYSLLRNDLDQFFDDFWSRNRLSNWPASSTGDGGAAFFPSVNVSETNGAYRVTADLPGLRRENVNVSVEGDALVISGSRTDETKDEDSNYICRECVTGEFRRVVALEDADVEKAHATMDSGVLTI